MRLDGTTFSFLSVFLLLDHMIILAIIQKIYCKNIKQLLDEVFVISRIIKVVVEVTETLIILDITKTESNSFFIIHWTKKQFISKRVKVYKLASNIKRANLT